MQACEVYSRILWDCFTDEHKVAAELRTKKDCKCIIPSLDNNLEPEAKWVVWRNHALIHDHFPIKTCGDCGILAGFNDIHQKFNCKDQKAYVLY